ncbi:MAG: peptidoglycan DD-metalloendopeptidase family protein [Lachnospiraceae bacterium]|nr:peptidoglycan DD-metalloendopeptidase family protein [Lachnospiraceae bacterium]
MRELLSTVSKIFISFAQKNISLSVVIVAILLGRLLLKKFPKRYSYLLWTCLGVRALFDLGLHLKLPKFGLPHSEADVTETINSAVAAGQKYIFEFGTVDKYDAPVKAALTARDILPGALFAIWVAGILAMVAYGIANFIKVKKVTAVSFKEESGLYRCDYIESPIAFGFIKPRVYVPSDCDVSAMHFVIEHEKTHIRRGDVYFKLIAFLILSAYWVNPLAWVAFKLFNLDMELSCDEAVIRRAGLEKREEYSRWLLYYSTESRFVSLAPTAFGETDTKRRVKNIMKLKKKGIISTIAGVVLLAAILVVCLVIAPSAQAEERDVSGAGAVSENDQETHEDSRLADTVLQEEAQTATVEETQTVEETKESETITFSRPLSQEDAGFLTQGYTEEHTGYDVAAPKGTAVHAMADGTVEYADYDYTAGNKLTIRVNSTTTYTYAHLDEILVKVGDKISSGETVATVGSTGASTGPHLHVEACKDGEYMRLDNNLAGAFFGSVNNSDEPLPNECTWLDD